ncbi:MAG: metal-dependent hydrolase [Methylotenera sp.]|uniref:metal-dependent hydrolase n=1 Tax=Methylotenera sp. TaxID=2051956 RepID=UPI002489B40E|nr:metal-dependent hydrolase [Methylotenera sp.]MDI1310349.1 metal-dependent hydrolase [Methylotenera sp.]
MPTIFSHAVAPIAASLGLGKVISRRLLVLSAFCAIVPDLDTLAFKFGIPYSSQWGHRGFTHSIAFALFVAAVAMCFNRKLKSKAWLVGLMVFLATVSHPLLDMFTNGGLGVALYWPYSNESVFFDFRPIAVSPIGVSHFFTERGLTVMKSEFLWVWLPSIILLFTLRGIRRK